MRLSTWLVVLGGVGVTGFAGGVAACAVSTTSPDSVVGGDDSSVADAAADSPSGLGDAVTRDAFLVDTQAGDDATGDVGSDVAQGDDGGAEAGMDAGDGASGDDGGPDGADASAECGTIPTLHPGNGTTLYCPFGPDGGPIQCVPKQDFCCISGKVQGVFPPSTCEPIASGACAATEAGVPGSTEIQCEDPATDCPSGNVCCGAPGSIAPVPGCGYDRLTGWKYTHCASGPTCAAGEFTACAATAECPTGQTCKPFKAKGLQLGYCQ